MKGGEGRFVGALEVKSRPGGLEGLGFEGGGGAGVVSAIVRCRRIVLE
jgi:hypothetical protein